MYLDLIDVLRAPGTTTEKPIAVEPCVIDDITFVGPITGVVRVANARRNLVIRGTAHTEVELECARCLQPYAQPLDLEFEASVPVGYFGGLVSGLPEREDDDEDELSAEELAVLFDGHSLDVLELVRQAAVLQAPRKPLCNENCAGLPEAKNYVEEPGDSRWAALKNWKDNNGSA
jgi:uncharacterized protein